MYVHVSVIVLFMSPTQVQKAVEKGNDIFYVSNNLNTKETTYFGTDLGKKFLDSKRELLLEFYKFCVGMWTELQREKNLMIKCTVNIIHLAVYSVSHFLQKALLAKSSSSIMITKRTQNWAKKNWLIFCSIYFLSNIEHVKYSILQL